MASWLELLKALQGGSPTLERETSLVEIYERLRRYALLERTRLPSIGLEEMEDLVGDVFVWLQERSVLGYLIDQSPGPGYFRVLVRHRMLDSLRTRQRRADARVMSEVQERFVARVESPAELFARSERHARLIELLASLPAEDLQLLELRFAREYSLAEISAEMRLSYSAVAVRIHRLIRRLRASMSSE